MYQSRFPDDVSTEPSTEPFSNYVPTLLHYLMYAYLLRLIHILIPTQQLPPQAYVFTSEKYAVSALGNSIMSSLSKVGGHRSPPNQVHCEALGTRTFATATLLHSDA